MVFTDAVGIHQLDALTAAVQEMARRSNGWDWHNGIPTALGAALGFGAALLQDSFRTRRELRKEDRQRREDELAQVGATVTALLFNLESAVHTVMQQVLPHYEASRGALDVFVAAEREPVHPSEVHQRIQQFLPNAFRRAPEPYLVAVDAFSAVSFLVNKHAELVKQCGWIESYARDLRFILKERNKLIDAVTIGAAAEGHNLDEVHFQMRTQISVSNVELGNSFQLIDVIVRSINGLIAIQASDYQGVAGPKLQIAYPPVLSEVRGHLQAALDAEGLWAEIAAVYAPQTPGATVSP